MKCHLPIWSSNSSVDRGSGATSGKPALTDNIGGLLRCILPQQYGLVAALLAGLSMSVKGKWSCGRREEETKADCRVYLYISACRSAVKTQHSAR